MLYHVLKFVIHIFCVPLLDQIVDHILIKRPSPTDQYIALGGSLWHLAAHNLTVQPPVVNSITICNQSRVTFDLLLCGSAQYIEYTEVPVCSVFVQLVFEEDGVVGGAGVDQVYECVLGFILNHSSYDLDHGGYTSATCQHPNTLELCAVRNNMVIYRLGLRAKANLWLKNYTVIIPQTQCVKTSLGRPAWSRSRLGKN